MWRITQELPRASSDFDHGGVTLSAGAFHLLDLSSKVPHRGPTTPGASSRFGLFRFRSPLLTESILFLFLRLLRCFTSPGFACFSLSSHTSSHWPPTHAGTGFRKRRWPITATGLPHSEISGSKRVCRSPKLIAAYHVLHRLSTPRHPLCALQSLIPCFETSFHGKVPPPLRERAFPVSRRVAIRPAALCRKNHICNLGFGICPRTAKALMGPFTRPPSRFFNSSRSFKSYCYLSMWMSKSGQFQKILDQVCVTAGLAGTKGIQTGIGCDMAQ